MRFPFIIAIFSMLTLAGCIVEPVRPAPVIVSPAPVYVTSVPNTVVVARPVRRVIVY